MHIRLLNNSPIRFPDFPLQWLGLPLLIAMAGCFGSRQIQTPIRAVPLLSLSGEQIHSPDGDMSARLPHNWVVMDASKLESPNVFATICDTNYTISVIFSEIAMDRSISSRLERDGVKGLVDLSFQRRWRRSNGRAAMVGDIEEFVIGRRRFSAYTYSTDSMATITRVALFNTPRSLYECAITPLTFHSDNAIGRDTLVELHQLILGGIDW